MKSSNTILNKEPKGDIPYFSIFLPALSVSTNQLRKGPPQSTVPKPPPPARPAAPRAPRFCRGGRLLAQRSLMSSSRLTGGSQSVTAQTTALREPWHKIRWALRRQVSGGARGGGAVRGLPGSPFKASPSFQSDSVSGEPILRNTIKTPAPGRLYAPGVVSDAVEHLRFTARSLVPRLRPPERCRIPPRSPQGGFPPPPSARVAPASRFRARESTTARPLRRTPRHGSSRPGSLRRSSVKSRRQSRSAIKAMPVAQTRPAPVLGRPRPVRFSG